MKSNLLIIRGRIITSYSLIAQYVHLSITMPNKQPSGTAKGIELEVDMVNYNSQEDKKSWAHKEMARNWLVQVLNSFVSVDLKYDDDVQNEEALKNIEAMVLVNTSQDYHKS